MELDAALTLLAREPSAPVDVAELALRLARDEYPALDIEGYLAELDAMAHELRRRLHGPLEARLAGLCRYLFHELGFRGNQSDYYDARNSYLNDVLDRRLGIPITLSAVAVAVGRRAGLGVEGVGLPGHFIAKAVGEGPEEILFDPFHGGRVLQPEQCEALVERATGEPFRLTAEALRPTPAGPVVRRMLANLKGVYLRDGDFVRAVRVMGRLRQLDPDDAQQRRDLGAALLQAGDPGRAIDHLQAYLDAAPVATDASLVRQVLKKARAAVAKWN
jgi:regulator of sirC expression with transglutaminase-like and TPR domain